MAKRVVVGLVIVALMIGVASASPVSAQPIVQGSIVVTPSVGLTNGQTVTAQGSGFAPTLNGTGSLTVGLCPGDVLNDPSSAALRCGASSVAFPVPVDGAGMFTTPLQVFTSQPTFLGDDTLNCLTPVGCAVLAIEVVFAGGQILRIIVAAAPVTFRPASVKDCVNGGWRFLTDDRGRPFRSTLRCVSFALRQRSAAVHPPFRTPLAPRFVFGRT